MGFGYLPSMSRFLNGFMILWFWQWWIMSFFLVENQPSWHGKFHWIFFGLILFSGFVDVSKLFLMNNWTSLFCLSLVLLVFLGINQKCFILCSFHGDVDEEGLNLKILLLLTRSPFRIFKHVDERKHRYKACSAESWSGSNSFFGWIFLLSHQS